MFRPSPDSAGRPRRAGLAIAVGLAGLAVLLVVPAVIEGGESLFGTVMAAYGAALYTSVGAVILSRRPGHGLGRLSMAIGVAFSISAVLSFGLRPVDPAGTVTPLFPGVAGFVYTVLDLVVDGLPGIALIVGATVLIIWFPDGRRTTRLGALAELIIVVGLVGGLISLLRTTALTSIGYSPGLDAAFDLAAAIPFVCVAGTYILEIVDIIRRYRRADPLRRTQMRWVLAGVGASAALTVVTLSGVFWPIWSLWLVGMTFPVIGIAIAITRYHLYDIDRIISRSISYVAISAILFGVFGGLILVLQTIISGAVARPGEPIDPAVVAASTLAAAALFDPVRVRVQRLVDHRFHRARYDAEWTVAGFAGRLRDQLDLPTVTGELRRTTAEAVEPVATGVWLRPTGDAG